MKHLKKAMLGLLCTVAVFNTCIPMASAAYCPTAATQNTAIVVCAEETEWRYKQVNGVWYKRLWSITYAKWKTDWTPIR